MCSYSFSLSLFVLLRSIFENMYNINILFILFEREREKRKEERRW